MHSILVKFYLKLWRNIFSLFKILGHRGMTEHKHPLKMVKEAYATLQKMSCTPGVGFEASAPDSFHLSASKHQPTSH